MVKIITTTKFYLFIINIYVIEPDYILNLHFMVDGSYYCYYYENFPTGYKWEFFFKVLLLKTHFWSALEMTQMTNNAIFYLKLPNIKLIILMCTIYTIILNDFIIFKNNLLIWGSSLLFIYIMVLHYDYIIL